MAVRRCVSLKDDGTPCQAPPLKDGDSCLMHSPEHAQEVAEGRRLGGLRRRREVAVSGAYEFNGLASVVDIRRLLEIAVVDTLGMENSIARSRTLAYLSQIALKALETGELESRISELEATVKGRSTAAPSAFDHDVDGVLEGLGS